jgi:hypothetical protein
MYELKTKQTDNSVIEFIEQVDSPKKREDAYRLLDIFTETTGFEAKMGDQVLLVLDPIITNTNQVMKGMHR